MKPELEWLMEHPGFVPTLENELSEWREYIRKIQADAVRDAADFVRARMKKDLHGYPMDDVGRELQEVDWELEKKAQELESP